MQNTSFDSIREQLNDLAVATNWDSAYIAGDGTIQRRTSCFGKTWHRVANIFTCGKHQIPPKIDIEAAKSTLDIWLTRAKNEGKYSSDRNLIQLVKGVVTTFNSFLLHETSVVPPLDSKTYLNIRTLSQKPIQQQVTAFTLGDKKKS